MPVAYQVAGADRATFDLWALERSGRTGHRRYHECVSVDLIARPTHEETTR